MNFTRRITTALAAVVISAGTLTLTAQAAQLMQGIGFVTGSDLRLRSQASTDSQVLDTAPKNDCVVVVEPGDTWTKVVYNLQEGYMHNDYLKVLTKENAELGYGSVTAADVNLRSGPSTAHAVVGKADRGDKYYILGLNEGWYKILTDEKTAYIRSDFMELTEIPYENQDSPNSPKYYRLGKAIGSLPGGTTGGSSAPQQPLVTGSGILSEAQKYLGTRYVYGGASPSGFDCSGLVYYVLKQCGYSPYRTPAEQFSQGSAVDKEDLQAGDIVFFANTYANGISHVGIYAGNGEFIHAPNSRSTVSYSDLTSGYWANHYYGARRMG